MKEIQVLRWCDYCRMTAAAGGTDDDDLPKVPAKTTPPLSLDGKKPKTLDLCDEHWMTLFEPLLLAVTGQGADPDSPAALPFRDRPRITGTRWTCPACGSEIVRSSVGAHLYGKHHLEPPVQPRVCPEGDYESDDQASMRTHRQRKHGWDLVTELLPQLEGMARA